MLVKHYPQIIEKIKFTVPFASDEVICKMMLKHYRMFSYIFKCVEDNVALLQDIADIKRDYYNKLYQTTLYEYNPIENYNMVEKESGNISATTNGSNTQKPNNWKTIVSNKGYGEAGAAAETTESAQVGTYDTTTAGNSNQNNNRTLTRSGNIGVTTSQQMIQSERDIILNLLEMYIKDFADCFNIEL